MNQLKKWGIFFILFALVGCSKNTEALWKEQYGLGMQYLTEGDYEQAILSFTAAIEIDPKLPEAYIGRGDAYSALEDFEKALADYEQAAELGAEGMDEKPEQVRVLLESHSLLSGLYDVPESGNIEQAKELMRQDKYIKNRSSISMIKINALWLLL